MKDTDFEQAMRESVAMSALLCDTQKHIDGLDVSELTAVTFSGGWSNVDELLDQVENESCRDFNARFNHYMGKFHLLVQETLEGIQKPGIPTAAPSQNQPDRGV